MVTPCRHGDQQQNDHNGMGPVGKHRHKCRTISKHHSQNDSRTQLGLRNQQTYCIYCTPMYIRKPSTAHKHTPMYCMYVRMYSTHTHTQHKYVHARTYCALTCSHTYVHMHTYIYTHCMHKHNTNM